MGGSKEHFFGGTFVEQELIGEVDRSYSERYRDVAYIPYNKAITMVKESQPWDTTDPEPRFANDLHALVAEGLDLEDYSKLRFYTAVSKTHADVFHGIDAFIEYEYEDGRGDTVRATIDLTTRPKEAGEWKADVLITIPPEGFDLQDTDDKIIYREVTNKAADEIIEVLRSKIPT